MTSKRKIAESHAVPGARVSPEPSRRLLAKLAAETAARVKAEARVAELEAGIAALQASLTAEPRPEPVEWR